MPLSIIIPTLNEAHQIAAILMRLQGYRSQNTEIILVDGGSRDDTVELAAPLVDRVITSKAGRATQMNAGAALATAEVLLFLHADTVLPAHAPQLILQGLTDARYRWGRFDVTIAGDHFFLAVIAWFMNHRSRLTARKKWSPAIVTSKRPHR